MYEEFVRKTRAQIRFLVAMGLLTEEDGKRFLLSLAKLAEEQRRAEFVRSLIGPDLEESLGDPEIGILNSL